MAISPWAAQIVSKLGAVTVQVDRMAAYQDAHIALLGAHTISQTLEKMLLAKMGPTSSTLKLDLFGPRGPLGDYAARSDVAFALKLMSAETYSALKTINKVRVKFAHPDTHTNFETPAVKNLVSAFVRLDESIPTVRARYMHKLALLNAELEASDVFSEPPTPTLAGWLYSFPEKSE